MHISKDVLRKQHEYNKQSNSFNLLISIMFALLFSLNNLNLGEKVTSVIVGLLLLFLLYNNIKTNYIADLYESRIVNENTNDPYEKVLVKIKQKDCSIPRKICEIFLESYFGFGLKSYWHFLLGHIFILLLSLYLIISPFR